MQRNSAENERRRIEGSYRWVAHGAIREYETCGWIVIDRMEDLHHGDHAVLMKWAGEGEPQ